jgi:hypothetical protein
MPLFSTSEKAVQFFLDASVLRNIIHVRDRTPAGDWVPSSRALRLVAEYAGGRVAVAPGVKRELQNPPVATPGAIRGSIEAGLNEIPFRAVNLPGGAELAHALQVEIQRRELKTAMRLPAHSRLPYLRPAFEGLPPDVLPDPTAIPVYAHLGEAQTAVGAYLHGAIAVIDDKTAAQVARNWLGIPVIGTYQLFQGFGNGSDFDTFWEFIEGLRAESRILGLPRRGLLDDATKEQFTTEIAHPELVIKPPPGFVVSDGALVRVTQEQSLPEPVVLSVDSRVGSRESMVTRFPVTGEPIEFRVASRGAVRIEMTAGDEIEIIEHARHLSAVRPRFDPENGRIRVGDLLDVMAETRDYQAPALTEIRIPDSAFGPIVFDIVTRDSTVELAGTEFAPVQLREMLSYGSSVTGRYVTLNGGDMKALRGTVALERVSADGEVRTQPFDVTDGARLSLECTRDTPQLLILRANDELTPQPVVTGSSWQQRDGDGPIEIHRGPEGPAPAPPARPTPLDDSDPAGAARVPDSPEPALPSRTDAGADGPADRAGAPDSDDARGEPDARLTNDKGRVARRVVPSRDRPVMESRGRERPVGRRDEPEGARARLPGREGRRPMRSPASPSGASQPADRDRPNVREPVTPREPGAAREPAGSDGSAAASRPMPLPLPTRDASPAPGVGH